MKERPNDSATTTSDDVLQAMHNDELWPDIAAAYLRERGWFDAGAGWVGPLCGSECIHSLTNAVEAEMFDEGVRDIAAHCEPDRRKVAELPLPPASKEEKE